MVNKHVDDVDWSFIVKADLERRYCCYCYYIVVSLFSRLILLLGGDVSITAIIRWFFFVGIIIIIIHIYRINNVEKTNYTGKQKLNK